MNNTILQNKATAIGSEYFSDWLRLKLKKTHTTYAQLGSALGYDRKAIMAYVNNQRSPRLDTVIAILDYFGEDCVNIPFRQAGG